MNKFEIIDRYAAFSGRTKTESAEIFEEVVSFVYDSVAAKESFDIYGFGVLEPYVNKSRPHHRLDGTVGMSKERIRVRFRPSKIFLDRLNGINKE